MDNLKEGERSASLALKSEWKESQLVEYFEVSVTTVEERLRAIKSNLKRAGLSLKP